MADTCHNSVGLQRGLVLLASWLPLSGTTGVIDHSGDNANVPRPRDSATTRDWLSYLVNPLQITARLTWGYDSELPFGCCEHYHGSIRPANPFLLFQRSCDNQTSLARRCIQPVPAATRCAGRQPCPCGKGELAKYRLLRRSIHLQQAERTGLPLRHARREKGGHDLAWLAGDRQPYVRIRGQPAEGRIRGAGDQSLDAARNYNHS